VTDGGQDISGRDRWQGRRSDLDAMLGRRAMGDLGPRTSRNASRPGARYPGQRSDPAMISPVTDSGHSLSEPFFPRGRRHGPLNATVPQRGPSVRGHHSGTRDISEQEMSSHPLGCMACSGMALPIQEGRPTVARAGSIVPVGQAVSCHESYVHCHSIGAAGQSSQS
jgi:hypothetical protein